MKPLVDDGDRRLIETDLDHNMIVEAAAGTGKTTCLVRRIVAVLRRGRSTVDRLVAVTFTEKAAGELKLRLRTEIEAARAGAQGDETDRLEHALAHLEQARVGTIHAFCADLLRERSVEARVDPLFVVMADGEDRRAYAEVFDLWLQRRLESPPEGLRRSLRRHSTGGPVERLRGAGLALVEWRDFPEPWRREEWDREAEIEDVLEAARVFAELSASSADRERDRLYEDSAPARRFVQALTRAEQVRERDWDGLEGQLVKLGDELRRMRKGRGRVYGPGVTREQVLQAADTLRERIEAFRRRADADLAALLQRELAEVTARYEEWKARSGKLDFVDLLLRTRDLLRDDASVRRHYQARLSHVFVDEFQDTDPLQAEILMLLAADDPAESDWRKARPTPGKLFLVADPKQSIYRFRRADVGTYYDVRDRLEGPATVSLRLTTNFRTVPSIQRAINRAFEPALDGDRETLQAEYVPLAPAREEIGGRPSVIALPIPKPFGSWGRISKVAVDESLPGAVAGFLDWLLSESGWTVTEREDPTRPVPVAARHVCLLFRRFGGFFAGDVTRPYVRALEARGIRHLLVGGRSFHEREEVETLRTALTAIEWPDDELSVFATLRGPLFSVGDETLLEYRHRFRRVHPFRIPAREPIPSRLSPVVDSLTLLRELHAARNRRPVAETIHLLLERTRAHAAFALRPSGEQVLANVLYVAEKARQYDGSGGISFRGFVERLIDDAERGQAPEAPILEEGSDGVRMMTVHKAKGLEFPVVVLADVSAAMVRREADRTVDHERRSCAMKIAGWSPTELREQEPVELSRDRAEGVRLAYVAATRARDLLVVPAIGSEPWESGWVSPLNRALYPEAADWSRGVPAAGCPDFGDESVHELPDPHARTVRPGAHRLEEHDYEVVWWDPACLSLDVPERHGIRREELISKKAPREVVDEGLATHARWKLDRDRALERASVPRMRVRTATADARDEAAPRESVERIEIAIDEDRPRGRRFGTLVHALIATVRLDGGREDLEATAAVCGRVLGAEEGEVDAACDAVARALEHPLIERARSAAERGACRRETPLTLRDEDGGVLDGVVDLAFAEEEEWIVVDFKTDRELGEETREVYERQVGLYARAVAQATGMPARAVLFRL